MFSSTTYCTRTHPFPLPPPPPILHHPYQIYSIDDEEQPLTEISDDNSFLSAAAGYYSSDDVSYCPEPYRPQREKLEGVSFYSNQAQTAHNRRMIIPFKNSRKPTNRSVINRGFTSLSSSASAGPGGRDEPLVIYRFFEFYCSTCSQGWLSPLYRAKDGLFCRMCHQYCQPRGIRHSFTPYLGKEICYGKYLCHICNRGFSSFKSLSHCPDQCFQCGTLVYPYYQIPHSLLYQKIRKNTNTNEFQSDQRPSTALDHFSPRIWQNDSSNGSASNRRPPNRPRIRRITSGIITSSSSVKQSSNKKRLHCLNNAQLLNNHVSLQQGRRQGSLKTCYSEPTIGNN